MLHLQRKDTVRANPGGVKDTETGGTTHTRNISQPAPLDSSPLFSSPAWELSPSLDPSGEMSQAQPHSGKMEMRH